MYGKSLDEAIAGEQDGDFGRVLRSVASGNRDDSDDVDQELAEKEAQELYDVCHINIQSYLVLNKESMV